MRAVSALVAAAIVIAAPAAVRAQPDDAPEAEFHLDSRPHVDVPFELQLTVEGLAESPQPDLPKLEIANARVTALGSQPNVMRSVQIVNGRRTDATRVTWVLRWRVVPTKEGSLHVPSVTVVQGSKHAPAQAVAPVAARAN